MALAALTGALPYAAHAHVAYVLPKDHDIGEAHWTGVILDPLRDPRMLALMAVTILLVVGSYLACRRVKAFRGYTDRLVAAAESDRDLVPWMLRLGVGISLIASGVHGYLVSPIVEATPLMSSIQLICGFALLAGFATGVSALLALGLFVYALAQDPYVIGNAETAASAIALLLFAQARPGIDQIVGLPFVPNLSRWKDWAPTVLRVILGVAMTFLAVWEKFFHVPASVEVVAAFGLDQIVPVSAQMWVLSAGIIEAVVGILLILGAFTRLTAAVAFLVLTASFFFFREDVTAHVTLFAAVSAVFVLGAGKASVDEAWMKAKR
jgi:uncharacterized membrane protein YphA (DoxX/SURF4 family)